MDSKKRLIITSVISIVLVSILLLGSTYSIFNSSDIDEEANVYKTGVLDISYTLSDENVTLNISHPMSESQVAGITPYRITVTNSGSVPYKFNVILDPTTASNEIDHQYIMTKVGEIGAKNLGACTDNIIKEGVIVPGKQSVDIDVRVWVSDEVKNTEIGKSFFAKLKIDGIATYNSSEDIDNGILVANKSLYREVKSSAVMDNIKSTYVSSSTGVDFSKISSDTNGKGVYIRSGTENDTFPIYYYRGDVTNNNVLFGGFCWKIVRTTETGGTKLIYNGTPKEVYDSNPIEEGEYTNVTNDATYPYTYDSTSKTWTSTNKTDGATGTITFGVKAAGVYFFNYTVSSEKKYDKAILYKDGTKIGEYSGSSSESISLGELTTSSVIKVEYTKDSSGSSGNDNVVFSIGKAVGEPKKSCNNTGDSTQIGTSAFNSSYNSPAYVGYMYGKVYAVAEKNLSSDSTSYVYGNNVTYSNGTYTLSNTISNGSWGSIYNTSNGIFNHHYTCFTTGSTCSSVYYIYYTNSGVAQYITLTGGTKVEDALSEMLDYNTTSSTIKGNKDTAGTIDNWYYTNIEQKGYSKYLEDTVWCSDRSIYQKNGWNPDGGVTSPSHLYFNGHDRAYETQLPSLSCSRNVDKFTVSSSNGNGNLDYPVGLLTSDEIMLAGADGNVTENRTYYLYSGVSYWAGTPYRFISNDSVVFHVGSAGGFGNAYVYISLGVRPSISLSIETVISSGDGTSDTPYVVQES